MSQNGPASKTSVCLRLIGTTCSCLPIILHAPQHAPNGPRRTSRHPLCYRQCCRVSLPYPLIRYHPTQNLKHNRLPLSSRPRLLISYFVYCWGGGRRRGGGGEGRGGAAGGAK